jgi:phospholipid-translocating P-type ATPase (flippase)
LTEKNLLLRGSTLRATEWALVAVVYTGADTKLSLNSKQTPSKLSSIDRIVNRTLAIAISTMILVCIISMIFEIVWSDSESNATYLCMRKIGGCESGAPSSYLTIFTFATLYNNFVCISMYVSLEMVYLCQGFFLSNDLGLYDVDRDTPAECHTSGMCADLGQVQYILSDKTGTLTKNLMVVQQFSVANKVYGKPLHGQELLSGAKAAENHDFGPAARVSFLSSEYRPSKVSKEMLDGIGVKDIHTLVNHTLFYPALEAIQSISSHPHPTASSEINNPTNEEPIDELERMLVLQLIRILVYCNTAMLMPDEVGKQEVENLEELLERLQAESADEVALIVAAAENCGVLLERRTSNEIVAAGIRSFYSPAIRRSVMKTSMAETVELLAVNEFDSDRKMMSVVVRIQGNLTGSTLLQNKTFLLCKGADSSVLSRCVENGSKYLSVCKSHIDYFANSGLRTLALAYRELDEEELEVWLKDYQTASSAIIGRGDSMKACAEKIERNLNLVGAIGIEDELQDGVPESIHLLHSAGINVWMITGDKAETAVAIGKKCGLILQGKDEIVKVINQSDEALRQRIFDLHSFLEKSKSTGIFQTLIH